MKYLASLYFWWVKVDKDIEKRVKIVNSAKKQSGPTSAPDHPWECTNNSWLRSHIGYLGPVMGKVF